MIVRNWAAGTWRRYVGNATSVRDYRSQLRGYRALWLWLIYLLLLIIIASAYYGQVASRVDGGLAGLQGQLKGFYYSVSGTLGLVVCLAAPALTATSVTTERLRGALDLVFSAPVSPRYYLIGKLISTLRYTLMLIVLSLPVLAVCVVLGGATWSDVLVTALCLCLASVCLSSIGLLISTLSNKVVNATLIAFVACGIYVAMVSALSMASFAASPAALMGLGTGSTPASPTAWLVGLNPFSAALAGTNSFVFGREIPSWILVAAWTLFFSRLLILGAESLLVPYGSREARDLRIGGVVYAGFFGALVGWITSQMSFATSRALIGEVTVLVSLFAFLVPVFGGSSPWSDRKNRAERWISIVDCFKGNPDGALPYIWLLTITFHIGCALAWQPVGTPAWALSMSATGSSTPPPAPLLADSVISSCLWSGAVLTFVWSLVRFSSGWGFEIRWARTLSYALMIVIFGLPVPILFAASVGAPSFPPDIMKLTPFFVSAFDSDVALAQAGVMLVLAIFIAVLSPRRSRQSSQKRMGVTA